MALPVALTAMAALFSIARPLQAQCYAEPERGFPVFVKAADGSIEDVDFLTATARAIAYRWQVPSSRRSEFRAWASRVHDRQIPPEPRWSDDWIPGDEHRAQVSMVLYRDGRLKGAPPKPASGDTAFDPSLRSIADEPMPGGPRLPAFPTSIKADSVVLTVLFGGDDQPQPIGLVRFAQVQTPAVLDTASLDLGRAVQAAGAGRGRRFGAGSTGGQRVIVKYDVMATGDVRALSIEVLETTDEALATLIKTTLPRARFQPPTQNCKPVSQTMLQTFIY